MASLKVVAVFLVISLAVAQAAVFGMNNVMYQRYPNGPEEAYDMEVPVLSSRSAGTVPRTQPDDSSWMFQRKPQFPVVRKFYYGRA